MAVAIMLALMSIRANELLGKTFISSDYLLIWVAIEG